MYAAPWVRGMWVDYLVVDGSAGLSESTRVILMRTDARRLVPVQLSGIDVQSAVDAVRLIFPSAIGETEPAQSADVFESGGEGNEAQKRSNGVIGT